jgi:ribosomal-protein-alanine N-acetyltransferase
MFTLEELSVSQIPEIPVLLTERLRLRSWSDSDVEMLERIYAKPEVTQFFSTVRLEPVSFEEIRAHWHRHGFGSWAVADRKTGQFLGSIGLAFPGHWPTPEISWVLDPRVWGRGYATEAALAIVDHAFRILRFQELMSVCVLGNKRSERVMQKLHMRRTSFLATASHDPIIRTYLLTREQWEIQSGRGRTPVR